MAEENNDFNPGGGDNSRRRLYERFKANIGHDSSMEYFDEDDLIEIYDYAGDYNDDFVKMEVLLYGARMFPESDDLKIRRDYLYYYLGYDDAVATMLERRGTPTTLSRLLALHATVDRGEATVEQLEDIMASLPMKMDDEEIIRFVDIAGAPPNYQWMVDNIDRIKECVEYTSTFLYEVANAADEMLDSSTALKCADELTMLEPFNIEFWELLADLNLNNHDFEAALSAVDYALALDPDSVRSRQIKGMALYNINRFSTESVDILMSVVAEDNFDTTAMQTLAMGLVNLRREDEAIELLRRYATAHPDDRSIADYLLLLDTGRMSATMESVTGPGIPDAEPFWADWALRHAANGRHDIAAIVLTEARRRGVLSSALPLLFEELYRSGRYTDVLSLADETADNPHGRNFETLMAIIMSYVRLGDRGKALHLATSALATDNSASPVYLNGTYSRMFSLIYANGGVRLLRSIADALSAPEPLSADDFDPFTL